MAIYSPFLSPYTNTVSGLVFGGRSQSCHYPPEGIRSYGGPRVQLYGGIDYYRRANQEIAVIVQIEHIDAVNRVDEILSVDGLTHSS